MSKFILQHRTSETVHSSLNDAILAINSISDGVDGEIVISRYKTETGTLKSVIGVTDGSVWNIFSYDDDIIDEKIASIVAGGDVDLSGYLKTVDFNSYTGTTQNAINQRLLTSEFNTYKSTVTTELGKKVDKTAYEAYTADTNTKLQLKADEETVKKTFVSKGVLNGEDILLKDFYGNTLSTIKLSDIIQKGMVEKVEIKGDNLVISWNTAAGIEDVEIPLVEIFNPDNYYTKEQVDSKSVFFETSEEYESAPKEDGITYYVGDAKIIYRDGEEFHLMGWAKFMDVEELYMPIVVYNDNNDKVEVYLSSEIEDMNETTHLTPIGIVVIPKEHDVYEDGSCGVMSLVNMSWKTPDIGDFGDYSENANDDNGHNLYFGSSGYTTGATYYNQLPSLGSYGGGVINSTIQGYVAKQYHIPSDMATGVPSPTDPYGRYYLDNTAERAYGISPYEGYSEDRNPLYNNGSLQYYNGKENTEKILALTNNESWKTSETLENDLTSGNYPSACACWRFSTQGTEQGDWYLPSLAEAGYLIARYKKISDTLQFVNEKFKFEYATPIDFGAMQNMWTSSAIASNTMACASTSTYSIATRSPIPSQTTMDKRGGTARALLKIKY